MTFGSFNGSGPGNTGSGGPMAFGSFNGSGTDNGGSGGPMAFGSFNGLGQQNDLPGPEHGESFMAGNAGNQNRMTRGMPSPGNPFGGPQGI